MQCYWIAFRKMKTISSNFYQRKFVCVFSPLEISIKSKTKQNKSKQILFRLFSWFDRCAQANAEGVECNEVFLSNTFSKLLVSTLYTFDLQSQYSLINGRRFDVETKSKQKNNNRKMAFKTKTQQKTPCKKKNTWKT